MGRTNLAFLLHDSYLHSQRYFHLIFNFLIYSYEISYLHVVVVFV